MGNMVITGITGFIGSHLAKALVESGHRLFGIVRPCSSRDLKPISSILEDVTLLTADITDYRSILNAFKVTNPDYICHLAALSPVRYSFEHPFQYQQHNFLGTMNVAHALMELSDWKKRRLIAASTAEVYGIQRTNTPFIETFPLKPASPYAVSKAAADNYLWMASKVYDLNCVILRPTNTFGRKHQTGFIVEYLVTNMLRKKKTYIGSPNSIRDYIYVDNHINAYLLAVEKEDADGEIYNIGSGRGISNRDLAFKIANIIGYDLSKIALGVYPPGYPLRPKISDQPYLVLNCDKIKRELGWEPHIDLDEGLIRTIQYWRMQYK